MYKHTVSVCCLICMFLVFYLLLQDQSERQNVFYLEKNYHLPYELNSDEIDSLVNLIDMDDFKTVLKPILVERVVGTRAHEVVKQYIADEMSKLNWSVEFDVFEDRTPNKGLLTFTNVIATFNIHAPRHLVFACHYDSKQMDNFVFLAATDSAVPCAILIYLAKILYKQLALYQNQYIGLKFIFFDGEEAFYEWSDTDSIYGSRHLASKMESTSFYHRGFNSTNDLHRIDILVLLDLLGAANPSFYSYFRNTERWYKVLVEIETALFQNNRLQYESSKTRRYFKESRFYNARISDDHEPFMKRGVPILHIIPTPFPRAWHTAQDNMSIVNLKTTKNLIMIFEIFIIQYLRGSSQDQQTRQNTAG